MTWSGFRSRQYLGVVHNDIVVVCSMFVGHCLVKLTSRDFKCQAMSDEEKNPTLQCTMPEKKTVDNLTDEPVSS